MKGFSELSCVDRIESDNADDSFSIQFQPETTIWSVNGGYIAASMLNAVSETSSFDTPTSLNIQFIRAVQTGEARIDVSPLHKSKTGAQLSKVTLSQSEKTRATADVWSYKPRTGPELREARMPIVPHADELKAVEELPQAGLFSLPFWSVFEQRQIGGIDIGARRHNSPQCLRWLKYKGDNKNGSRFLRAGMTIPIIDLLAVVAAKNGYGDNILVSLAPTINLVAHFYELEKADGWLLGEAHAEYVGNGLLCGRVSIWSSHGDLIAQGMTQMIMKDGSGEYTK